MIDDLDGALTNIADHARLKKGLVRVAAPQLLSCTLLPQAIAAYRGEYPDIAVRLADCGVERVIARVLSGAVDFGIGPEREPAPQLEARELFEMPFVLVCPPGHPLAARQRVSWKEIADHPFISLQGDFTERLLADMHALQRDLQLHRVPAVCGLAGRVDQNGTCLTYACLKLHPLWSRAVVFLLARLDVGKPA
jgi:DNA-binding transcriptional LysR family regulator